MGLWGIVSAMPYVLLAIGVAIGLWGLYRFLTNATPKQVITMLLTVTTGVLAAALFVLAVSGRLPAAMALLAGLWPIGVGLYRMRYGEKKKQSPGPQPANTPMTRAEALEILGLDAGADVDAINDSYRRLMQKVHPDHEGSEWMAAKLNAARDLLLSPDQN